MTVNPESANTAGGHDEEEVMFEDDVEELRKKLMLLSEQGEIKHTKAFLSNKKKCNEKVMKKIMSEYSEKKQRIAKMEMSIAFITLLPNLIKKTGLLKFQDGASAFSAKILADENSMFCIPDMMPSCEGGDYYFKYISAGLFLTSLCYHNIIFSAKTDGETDRNGPPQKKDETENKS